MEALIRLREKKNISRKEISSKINMRYSNYCTLERSNVELPFEHILTIATEYDIPFYELIDDPYTKQMAKTIKIV